MNTIKKLGMLLFISMTVFSAYGASLVGDFPIEALYPEQKIGLSIMVVGSMFAVYGLGIWTVADLNQKTKEE